MNKLFWDTREEKHQTAAKGHFVPQLLLLNWFWRLGGPCGVCASAAIPAAILGRLPLCVPRDGQRAALKVILWQVSVANSVFPHDKGYKALVAFQPLLIFPPKEEGRCGQHHERPWNIIRFVHLVCAFCSLSVGFHRAVALLRSHTHTHRLNSARTPMGGFPFLEMSSNLMDMCVSQGSKCHPTEPFILV